MEPIEKTNELLGGKVNLDLGLLSLNIDLSIKGIKTLTDTLQSTLQETTGTLSENVTKLVDTVMQLGPEQLIAWAQKGGEEAKQLFNKLYSQLEEAAKRGSAQAGEVVQKLGGKMQTAGEKEQPTH